MFGIAKGENLTATQSSFVFGEAFRYQSSGNGISVCGPLRTGPFQHLQGNGS